MDAKITVTATPSEFDLVRQAMTRDMQRMHETCRDDSVEPQARQAARQTEAQLADLLRKLS